MMNYLASDKPLSLIAWNEALPGFNVTELNEGESAVRQQFAKPYVYYLGAHTGCSCGFIYGQYEEAEEVEEEAGRESVRQLSAYLAQAVKVAGDLELYACWDGDQQAKPEHHSVLSPSQVGGESFRFQERQFSQIIPDAP